LDVANNPASLILDAYRKHVAITQKINDNKL